MTRLLKRSVRAVLLGAALVATLVGAGLLRGAVGTAGSAPERGTLGTDAGAVPQRGSVAERPAPRSGTERAVAAPPRDPSRSEVAGGTPAERIELAFLLDPRLTTGLHLGARWVSPPRYSHAGEDGFARVQARARVVDASGRRTSLAPTWSTSAPGLVELSRGTGDAVTITVWRPGSATLTVATGGAARELRLEAFEDAGRLRVEILQ